MENDNKQQKWRCIMSISDDKRFSVKPRIFISKCIEFDHCRYNGQLISSPVVRALKEYADIVKVCPEIGIGLGVPREAVRLIKVKNGIRLVNSLSGDDVTDKMIDFSNDYLSNLGEIDGFILKSRSPSCGSSDVKIYPTFGKVGALPLKSYGLFGKSVLEHYPNVACEDEGRLTNLRIREYFLTKIYTSAEFRSLGKNMKDIIGFHSRNKYLFMAYNQTALKRGGQIIANHEKLSVEEVFNLYREQLNRIFTKMSPIGRNINVIQHIYGYFSSNLNSREKEHFQKILEDYKNKKLPLSVVTTLLKSWAYRFNDRYLLKQTYLNLYPEELQTIRDSGKGRIIK